MERARNPAPFFHVSGPASQQMCSGDGAESPPVGARHSRNAWWRGLAVVSQGARRSLLACVKAKALRFNPESLRVFLRRGCCLSSPRTDGSAQPHCPWRFRCGFSEGDARSCSGVAAEPLAVAQNAFIQQIRARRQAAPLPQERPAGRSRLSPYQGFFKGLAGGIPTSRCPNAGTSGSRQTAFTHAQPVVLSWLHGQNHGSV